MFENNYLIASGLGLVCMVVMFIAMLFSNPNGHLRSMFRLSIFKIAYYLSFLLHVVSIIAIFEVHPLLDVIPYKILVSAAWILYVLISAKSLGDVYSSRRYLFYVIDDEVDLLEVMTMKLEDMFDCHVLQFKNTKDAASALADINKLPDIIICDIKMPGENGLMFKKTLKDLHLNIPIVFFTGLGGDDVRDGDTIILSKTISDIDLQKQLKRFLTK